jgi:glycogen operon protein
VSFSVYSSDAQRMELLLYDHVDDAEPARVIDLTAPAHRTWHYWHACVPGLRAGQLYAWRAGGAHDAVRGPRFDADKVLLDPYGHAVALPARWRRSAACTARRNDAYAAKSVVADRRAYDWQGDRTAAPALRADRSSTSCTCAASRATRARGVEPARAGTYAGLGGQRSLPAWTWASRRWS